MSTAKPFAKLLVWRDPDPRPGPECMAVDEMILRGLGGIPVLRVYDWDGPWASVGYFGDLAAARAEFGPDVEVIKRWTGGGLVDHREDLTYSLMIPLGAPLAKARRLEAYRVIHEAVADALVGCGLDARLIARDSPGDSPHCFEKPVAWDVVDTSGRKLAGAGQRRTRDGLLHQGSVLVGRSRLEGVAFADALVTALTDSPGGWEPGPAVIEAARELAMEKY